MFAKCVFSVVAVLLLMVGTFSSCLRTQDNGAVPTITIPEAAHRGKVNVFDLVDSISYVPLETSDQILLGDVMGVKQADGYYFVQDSRGLYAFDAAGRFVAEIGHRGIAPEEYINLDCFYVDASKKLVGIVSNYQRKILRYTFQGIFHSSLTLSKKYANIVSVLPCGEDSLLVHFPLPNEAAGTDCEYALLTVHGSELSGKELLDAPPVHSGVARHPFSYYPTAPFQGKNYFIPAFSNRFYTLEGDAAKVAYAVDVPGLAPDGRFLQRHKDLDFFQLRDVMRTEGVSMGITAIEAMDDYLFMSLNNGETLIWDGEKCMTVTAVYNPSLDTWANLLLVGGVSCEHVGIIQSDFLYANKERLMEGGDERLAAIARQIKEDDNPVLFRYHFKRLLFDVSMRVCQNREEIENLLFPF